MYTGIEEMALLTEKEDTTYHLLNHAPSIADRSNVSKAIKIYTERVTNAVVVFVYILVTKPFQISHVVSRYTLDLIVTSCLRTTIASLNEGRDLEHCLFRILEAQNDT